MPKFRFAEGVEEGLAEPGPVQEAAPNASVNPLPILRLALQVISERLILAGALGVASWLFVEAVYRPDLGRTLAASLFTVLVFLPLIFWRSR